MKSIKGSLLVIISAISFGLMPVFAKIAYENGSNNYTVLALRFIFSSIVLLIYMSVKKVSMKISIKEFKYILLITVFGYVVCSLSYFTSFEYITVGLSTMLLYTHPALVVIFSAIIYKDKLNIKKIASIGITTLGIYLLVDFRGAEFDLYGIVLATISSVTYCIYIIGLGTETLKKVNSMVITFYVCLVSAIVVSSFGLMNNQIIWSQNIITISCSFFLAIISTLVAMLTFIEGAKIVGSSKAAIISTFEPVVSLVLAIILFNEVITTSLAIGSTLIIISIIIYSTNS